MKAILLAAGLGTRLRPLTDTIPKCMVDVGGKPLLGHWLEKLVNLGIEEILINTHYKADIVEKYIKAHPYRNRITLSYESKLLDTGSTLLANLAFWKNQEVIVAHADNFTLSNLSGLVKQHQSRSFDCDATMLLFETDSPKSCGVVKLDAQNRVIEFHEKVINPPSNLANGATFIFATEVFNRFFSNLEKDKTYSLCADIIPTMLNHMQGWFVDDFYIDIGTPSAYNYANKLATTTQDY